VVRRQPTASRHVLAASSSASSDAALLVAVAFSLAVEMAM
jgi:hypothetical protein